MSQLSNLLLYIPGIIIFLVGSGQVRRYLALKRNGTVYGDVVSCQNIIKKDKKDREIYNYYNVTVEYTNPETHHKERHAVKSASEFAEGQQVQVFSEKRTGNYEIIENETSFVINPWEMMVGGALLILLALFTNQGKQVPAMICLALVLAGAGAALIFDYVSLSRRNLESVTGEVIRVYTRQISRGTKIVKGDKFTYYPVVKYTADGRENIRKCSVNSSNEKSFKVGDTLTLYYDPDLKTVFERNANKFFLILGIALLAVGVLAGASILSVL